MNLEKTPLKSKKFIAFFFTTLILTGIVITALVLQKFVWAMAVFMGICVLGIVFLGVGYVLSQAALDKLVRGIGALSGTVGKLGGNDDEEDEPADGDLE